MRVELTAISTKSSGNHQSLNWMFRFISHPEILLVKWSAHQLLTTWRIDRRRYANCGNWGERETKIPHHRKNCEIVTRNLAAQCRLFCLMHAQRSTQFVTKINFMCNFFFSNRMNFIISAMNLSAVDGRRITYASAYHTSIHIYLCK